MAHLGGFIGGVILIKLFGKKKNKNQNDFLYTWNEDYHKS